MYMCLKIWKYVQLYTQQFQHDVFILEEREEGWVFSQISCDLFHEISGAKYN